MKVAPSRARRQSPPVPSKPSSTLDLLRAHESRNVTFLDPDGSWPIVWTRARGSHVRDANGRRYLDLTAAFGVAAAGHANPRVVAAGRRQMGTLLHAMGDVHPHPGKAALLRELSRLTFERWDAGPAKSILGSSGFEAVEAALKTARLATGRPGIIALEGGYHGVGYGALNATQRPHFREPFKNQLGEFGRFVPFPENPEQLPAVERALRKLAARTPPGAILVEPMQARGGIRIPPPGFLPLLRRLADEFGSLLILDEIYTGFGRTGRWFACEHAGVIPDLICLGKALTGGFPMSACVGRADVMDRAWPASDGEAIHTSTFLGHPVGCAMALAQIQEIRRLRLPERAAQVGSEFLEALSKRLGDGGNRNRIRVRGVGLMAGVELLDAAGRPDTANSLRIVKALLGRGFIVLPEGAHANVIGLTPPLTISRRDLLRSAAALADEVLRIPEGR
jgi:4-aminobutyrate aminotransferase-like enzyme